jgi:hypothetical protein
VRLRESQRHEGEVRRRQNQQRSTATALGAVGLGVVGPIVGAHNPWNLLVVDSFLDHPSIGALVALAGVVAMWSMHAPETAATRTGGFVVCGIVGVAIIVATVALIISRPNILHTTTTSNGLNDVEAHITRARYGVMGREIWAVSLAADRGLASRENAVAVLQLVDYGGHHHYESAPITLDAAFTTAGRLEIQANGRLAYAVEFDPDDLRVRSEDCFGVPGPLSWGATFGCGDDLSEWQF